MDYINNNGKKIGSLTIAIGKDKTGVVPLADTNG
jgi:hypothetical protein